MLGNRNLFVTNSECGVEEKQMNRGNNGILAF